MPDKDVRLGKDRSYKQQVGDGAGPQTQVPLTLNHMLLTLMITWKPTGTCFIEATGSLLLHELFLIVKLLILI